MAETAAQVKELREKTGAGIMDAKRALVETDGFIPLDDPLKELNSMAQLFLSNLVMKITQ